MKHILIVVFAMGLTVSAIDQQCDPAQALSDKSSSFRLAEVCPDNSHCLDNRFCACDSGFIGNCLQKAFPMEHEVEKKANLTSAGYTFFEVVGDS